MQCSIIYHLVCFCVCVCVCVVCVVSVRACSGQSLSSVKEKAGEALRLHRTSVGEEVQEEERSEGGGGDGQAEASEGPPPSAVVASRGVFSTLTHAVQNTVREHARTHTRAHTIHTNNTDILVRHLHT